MRLKLYFKKEKNRNFGCEKFNKLDKECIESICSRVDQMAERITDMQGRNFGIAQKR